jgi:hypothetical protein
MMQNQLAKIDLRSYRSGWSPRAAETVTITIRVPLNLELTFHVNYYSAPTKHLSTCRTRTTLPRFADVR